MAKLADSFIPDLLSDIKENRLNLPTLPDVALRIRQVVNNNEAPATQIAKLIGVDQAISARLLQVANSPLYRGTTPIESLQSAIARLGVDTTRNLVTSLLLKQIFQTKSASLKKRMQDLWEHSTQVAAISHVLARRFTKLKPDEAMLAGLIHDIGALPIINKVDATNDPLDNETLDDAIERLHPSIGRILLETWKFPPELVTVPAEHENLLRTSEALDYTDIVTVANLHAVIGTKHRLGQIKLADVPAVQKMKLDPKQAVAALDEARTEINELKRLIG